MPNTARFRQFVQDMTRLVESAGSDEPRMVKQGSKLLKTLIAHDDWLPEAFTVPSPERYQQYLLHCDPLERFSVVSFVWGPGQSTPIHNHTVWGLVGLLRGAEKCEEYAKESADLKLQKTGEHLIEPGGIDAVSPTLGDIHVVSNAFSDRPSISIHVYGANIGAVHRHTFDAVTGEPKPFVSGYANTVVPNLWDRSAA